MKVGFSTGSIAYDDVRRGLAVASRGRAKAVELSALREAELDPLLASLDELRPALKPFDYVSLHAPSKLVELTEEELIQRLQVVAGRGWAIIVHPDMIRDFSLWRKLGSAVCIENMDKRKQVGRTTAQLSNIFEQLPEATFCFDVGHARQIDPTMQEARAMLRAFGNRLRQVHMSYVNSQCQHERLNSLSIMAFREISGMFDESTPIILETPVTQESAEEEISAAERVFHPANLPAEISRTLALH